jgi:type IX secretion system substrate protein
VFEHVNGVERLNLAAFDATNGTLRDWAPSPNGGREDAYTASVDVLATRGSTVFVGGDFTLIAGRHQASLAALDGVTGELLDWDPKPDQSVHALEVSGDRLYAGGYFQVVAGIPHLALLGATLPGWTPSPISFGPAVVLSPIRPNPFGVDATISYVLPVTAPVSLAVYDLQGRRVETLLDRQVQSAGPHQVQVNARHLRIGCYFLRLEAGRAVRTQKAVVVR